MADEARKRGAPTPIDGHRERRINALAAKIVAVLLALYMVGVAGFFVYDHLL